MLADFRCPPVLFKSHGLKALFLEFLHATRIDGLCEHFPGSANGILLILSHHFQIGLRIRQQYRPLIVSTHTGRRESDR